MKFKFPKTIITPVFEIYNLFVSGLNIDTNRTFGLIINNHSCNRCDY